MKGGSFNPVVVDEGGFLDNSINKISRKKSTRRSSKMFDDDASNHYSTNQIDDLINYLKNCYKELENL